MFKQATLDMANDVKPTAANGDAAAKPGRDAKGRFTAGNKGGPGNPFGRRLAEMRQAVLRAVTPADIERVMAMLLQKANVGDVAAAKLVLQYAVGKPQTVAEPDRVEVDEWQLQRRLSVPGDEFFGAMNGVPTRLANVTASEYYPVREKTFIEMYLNPKAKDDDAMTPEEEAEIEEIKKAYAAEMAAQPAVDRPSAAGLNGQSSRRVDKGADWPANAANNGDRPSAAGGNGDAVVNWTYRGNTRESLRRKSRSTM
jgi:hypothetical protein